MYTQTHIYLDIITEEETSVPSKYMLYICGAGGASSGEKV